MYVNEIIVFAKHHVILVSVWFLLLGIILYTIIIHWIRKNCEISCDDAIFLMNKKNAVIIDIRTREEYDSGYIMNSINFPLLDIKKNNVFLYKNFKGVPLIIVDSYMVSSSYSIRKYLNKLGFFEVYVLKGGISSWKNFDFPLLFKNK